MTCGQPRCIMLTQKISITSETTSLDRLELQRKHCIVILLILSYHMHIVRSVPASVCYRIYKEAKTNGVYELCHKILGYTCIILMTCSHSNLEHFPAQAQSRWVQNYRCVCFYGAVETLLYSFTVGRGFGARFQKP